MERCALLLLLLSSAVKAILEGELKKGLASEQVADLRAALLSQQGLDDSSRCVLACLKSLQAAEMQIPSLDNMEKQFGTNVEGPYRQFLFKVVCDTYRTHAQCLDGCGQGEAKTIARQSLEAMDFVCVRRYQEFQAHMQCYVGVKGQIEEECSKESACGSSQSLVAHLQGLLGLPEEQRLMQSLGRVCAFVQCRQDCFRPILTSTCGPKAASLIDEFSATTKEGFRQQLDALNTKGLVPPVCAKFQANQPPRRSQVQPAPATPIQLPDNNQGFHPNAPPQVDLTKVRRPTTWQVPQRTIHSGRINQGGNFVVSSGSIGSTRNSIPRPPTQTQPTRDTKFRKIQAEIEPIVQEVEGSLITTVLTVIFSTAAAALLIIGAIALLRNRTRLGGLQNKFQKMLNQRVTAKYTY